MGMIEWDVYMESMLMNSAALDDVARAFRDAAEAFGEIVARPEVGTAWEQPSVLDGLTVGGIVGHVNAGIGWLGPLLDAPVQPDLRPSPRNSVLGFFSGLKIGTGGADRSPLHDMVDHQAERAARHGWESNPTGLPPAAPPTRPGWPTATAAPVPPARGCPRGRAPSPREPPRQDRGCGTPPRRS